MSSRSATTDHPVQQAIADRWSPYGFDPTRTIPREELLSLFEAARWAASSFNEQPWRFILATRDDETGFARILRCLVEANRGWAGNAAGLMLGSTRTTFTRNDKPNRVALHDLGLAAGNLSIEATARGISVHQMAGILPDVARETYRIPDGFEPQTAIAIGYASDPGSLPEDVRARDDGPRERRALDEFVFGGSWGEPASILDGDAGD